MANLTMEEYVRKVGLEGAFKELAESFYAQFGPAPWELEEKDISKPSEGFVKPGGWGGNKDPNTWKVINMTDRSELFKVVDNADINIATDFTTKENAQKYIDFHKFNPPDDDGNGEDRKFPIPSEFRTKGSISTAFKHWGRHTVNYASGGSGPSERWNNDEIQALNVLAGYEVNIGDRFTRDNDKVDLKFRGSNHSDGKGGWYILAMDWNGKGFVGKEFPHPKTNSGETPQQSAGSIGSIKNRWVGFLAAVFDDSEGNPTLMVWGNPDADGKIENYKLIGKSEDKGNIEPGPILRRIGQRGGGKQQLQIRMDEAKDAKIRNAFAVEIEAPSQ